jgi:hypothetical protein
MNFITDNKHFIAPRRKYRLMWERLSILAIAGLAACHGVDVEPPNSGTDRGLPAVAERSEPGANLHASRTPGTAQRFPLALAGVPLPIPVSTQFDITGFLREAHTAGPNAGGTCASTVRSWRSPRTRS